MVRAKGRLIEKVLIGNLSGKRPLGRPYQRWIDTVKRDSMISTNLPCTATNRNQWSGLVEAAKDPF